MKTVLLSSHGEATFDEEGKLFESRLDLEGYPLPKQPSRLDVAEFKRRYPGEPHAGEWDILDWGYWTQDGTYVPAERGDIL